MKLKKYIFFALFLFCIPLSAQRANKIAQTFDQSRLPEKYSRIEYNQNVIVAQKADSTYDIYNNNIQKINNSTVRYVDLKNEYTMQILDGNELRYIVDGQVVPRPVVEVTSISVVENVTEVAIKKLQTGFRLSVKKNNGRPQNYTLRSKEKISDIRFLNNDLSVLQIDGFRGYQSPYEWAYVKIEGKYGIYAYKINKKTFTFSLEPILPAVCDSIELYGYNYPLYFTVDDLHGMYPTVNEAKYKRLDKVEVNLARFALPDGHEGWIEAATGREFIDM